MTTTTDAEFQDIRAMRYDESDEFITLMEIAFKDSIEEDRLDAAEVRKVMKKVQSPFFKFLSRVLGMKMEFYVAERDNKIASGILLQIDKNEVYVGDLMTLPTYRRQGFARKLLRLSFKRARERGLKKVTLGARADNVNAVDLYKSEGFETTFHTGRFEYDYENDDTVNTSNDLIITEITKVVFEDVDPMLDDCFPESHLEVQGREKFVKDFVPSRVMRFFAKRLGGQLVNTYAFSTPGDERPRGYIQASQSRIEQRIRFSSPVLKEQDNDLLREVIPRILEIERGYRGVRTASINCSMHRTDAISKIESLGFKKIRESLSMTKRL